MILVTTLVFAAWHSCALMGAAVVDASDAFTGKTVLVLVGAASLFSNVVMAWAMARRVPPVQEELYRNYVTSAEFEKLRHELASDTGGLHKRIDALISEIHRVHADAERARGRMSGEMEAVTTAVSELREWMKELLSK